MVYTIMKYCINSKCKNEQIIYNCSHRIRSKWLKRKDKLLICIKTMNDIKKENKKFVRGNHLVKHSYAKHKMCGSCYHKFLRPSTYPTFKVIQ